MVRLSGETGRAARICSRCVSPAGQFWLMETGLPALGLGLFSGGVAWERAWLIDVGICVLALAAASTGVTCIAKRRVVFMAPIEVYRLIVWQGPAALFVGAGLLVLGLMIGAVGLSHAAGVSATTILEGVFARPGLVLAPGGVAMLAGGIAAIIGFPEGRDPEHGAMWNLFMSIPSRLGGLILSTAGGAAMAIGLYELVAPEAFGRLIASLAHGLTRH